MSTSSIIAEIESLIRRDPAARGLVVGDSREAPLCAGHLGLAADDLARHGQHAAIVTGFFVPDAQPPAAETDGPPGAAMLGATLAALGMRATLVTDEYCAGAVRAAARAAGLDRDCLTVCPQAAGDWIESFLQSERGRSLTHLIAIERVGPSHDETSLALQPRPCAPPLDEFRALVPPARRNHCHNIRGRLIDDTTAPLHGLFEVGPQRVTGLRTIGIGDGGNEIGMGSVLWEELARRSTSAEAAAAPCRIATNYTIVAGTSNWGAFGLAAATALLAGRAEVVLPFDEEFHRASLERFVAEGPAVDGITRRREPTVDGLPFGTYIQIWLGIRRLVLSGPARLEEAS